MNELARMARHGDADLTTGALQAAQYLDGLVGSNATGNADRHARSRELFLVLVGAHLEIENVTPPNYSCNTATS